MIIEFEELLKRREEFEKLSAIIRKGGWRIIVLVHPYYRYGNYRYEVTYARALKRLIEENKFPIFVLEESTDREGLARQKLLEDIRTEDKQIVIIPTIKRFAVPDIDLRELLGSNFDKYLAETQIKPNEISLFESAKRFIAEKLVELGVTHIYLGGEMGKAVKPQTLHPKHCVNATKNFIERYSNIKIFIMERALLL